VKEPYAQRKGEYAPGRSIKGGGVETRIPK
jgi:hypothetical protein